MKQRFTNLISNKIGFEYYDTSRNVVCSCKFDFFLIREAWNKGCNFEDLADGYGSGYGTIGGIENQIRASSHTATEKMFERALNFLFPN